MNRAVNGTAVISSTCVNTINWLVHLSSKPNWICFMLWVEPSKKSLWIAWILWFKKKKVHNCLQSEWLCNNDSIRYHRGSRWFNAVWEEGKSKHVTTDQCVHSLSTTWGTCRQTCTTLDCIWTGKPDTIQLPTDQGTKQIHFLKCLIYIHFFISTYGKVENK